MSGGPRFTPELWGRALSIVREIAEADPAAREDLLSERADGDETLREALTALVAEFDEDSVGLVDELDERLGLVDRPGDPILPQVEGVELTGVLGRGGSGDVYAGRQLSPERAVAVKVLRSGLSSQRTVRRFNREARALAAIEHEAVASVYALAEARLPGGSVAPCLIMEWVRGQTLREVEKPIAPREAARLVARLARGLHAAHQRGVVHRDVKPSNIIVDEAGSPKLIDFGIAALDAGGGADTLHTITGELLGTLGYMSPEQIEGGTDIADVRTDVYALGVVLFELFTGRPAVDAASGSSLAIVNAIAHGALPRLPGGGDADAIYRKATARELTQRYESASALADDLDRFIEGHPVRARPPSPLHWVSLFVRRNPVPVALGTLAIVAVLGLATTTAVGFVLASRERDAARDAELRAVEASAFLRDMLSSPDPDVDGPDVRVVDLLDRSAGLIDELHGRSPLVALDLHRTVGWTYAALSRHDDAAAHLERAAAIADEHLAPNSDERLRLMVDLADSLVYLGRYDEAEAMLRDVVGRCEANAEEVAVETHVAAIAGLAEAVRNSGDVGEGLDLLERARAISGDRLGEGHPQHQSVLSAIGRAYLDQNMASDARMIYEELLGTYEPGDLSNRSGLLIARGNLAIALAGEGEHERAIEIYEDVLATGEPVLGSSHYTLRMVRGILPDSYFAVGRADDAIAMSERALADAEAIYGKGHPDELLAVSNHAVLLMQLERWSEAIVYTSRLASELPGVLGEDHPRTLIGLRNHAAALDMLDRDEESAQVLQRILRVQRASLGDDHFDTLVTKNNLAFLYEATGRPVEAVGLMREVMEVAGPSSGFPEPVQAVFRLNLGRALVSTGRHDEAEQELLESKRLNPDSPTHAEKVDRELDRIEAARQSATQPST